jgi:membrane peptidoglycan carboxypeptidase
MLRRKPRIGWERIIATATFAAALGIVLWAARIEIAASPLQAQLFTRYAGEMTYQLGEGAAPDLRHPGAGPYDLRLGYAQLPNFAASLRAHDYVIARQTRMSPTLKRFIDLGGFPIFREKAQAGLTVLDRNGDTVYSARHPEQVFADFSSIPRLIVDTLLFIENRELLDGAHPTRNPAVEWDRFAAAAVNVMADRIAPTGRKFGGSTLATQIEKYRHSPDGLTGSVREKLEQMASASLRAYQGGRDTTHSRRRIVIDYLNSTPLAARPGFGEVIGLGDGLWAWFGTDLDTATRLLAAAADGAPQTAAERAQAARVYRQVLSLMLAQRRPTYYLLQGRDDLSVLTDSHLRLLAEAGIITAEMRDLALAEPPAFRLHAPAPADVSFMDRKAINATRAHLLSLLGLNSLYDLDRIDLRVEATIDTHVQNAVVEMLRRISDPQQVEKLGLAGARLLDPQTASQVRYSVTVYEKGVFGHALRVQADNLDRPLDLNEGGMLDLGSTAKLRTLASYLEIVAELHRRYRRLSGAELAEVEGDGADPLTRWAVAYVRGSRERGLQPMLDAAMARRYSASPAERFFTGRGLHRFVNFNRIHDHQVITVSEALRHSVNLVFIRMMRDIVQFHIAEGPQPAREILADGDHPARQAYLARFADFEGSLFLQRFFRRYQGRSPDEALAILASRSRPVPHRLAVVFRSVRPEADLDAFARFMTARLGDAAPPRLELASLYASYGPDRFDLQDRGYIARVHPLELWLVHYRQRHPEAARAEIIEASAEARQTVYRWLFRTKRQGAANTRIRIMLEREAFRRIHASWQRLGYPFPELVASYATAIGSSADRPAALAELMGIILSDGVRLPMVRVDRLHFAEDTPYETHIGFHVDRVERVMPREVARTLQGALRDVVENGTARRAQGAFVDAGGSVLAVGGKTGTGDELADTAAAGAAREVSRSAAFVFYIGDRFFGVVTAHVPGDMVNRYRFTSALPVQVLATLAPALRGAGISPVVATRSV